jgi:SAM-dependent methyltransferase
MAFLDRQRADSFGAIAELYDRVRPSYPPDLIAELLAGGGRPVERILDVGAGTGKLARQLIDTDPVAPDLGPSQRPGPDRDRPARQVLGLEPDARMAEVAAAHGIEIEIATLEDWDAAGRIFDLLTAGQAWHWVSPTAGAVKAREVLRPGARLAALWNRMSHDPDVKAITTAVYDRYAPHLTDGSIVTGADDTVLHRITPAAEGLIGAGFVDIDIRSGDDYLRTVDYMPADWIALISTHSDHAVLDAETRVPMLADLEAGLAMLGPAFPVHLSTDALIATRSGDERTVAPLDDGRSSP